MQPRACPSIPWTLRRGMPRVLFTIGVFSASTAAFEEPPSPALCSRLPTEEAGDPTESPTTIPAGARDRSLVPPERARPPSDRVGGSITSVRCLRRDWADRGGAIPLPRQTVSNGKKAQAALRRGTVLPCTCIAHKPIPRLQILAGELAGLRPAGTDAGCRPRRTRARRRRRSVCLSAVRSFTGAPRAHRAAARSRAAGLTFCARCAPCLRTPTRSC